MFIKPLEFLQKKRNLLVTHRATVKDNADPKKLGRVKIEVKGLIEGDTEKLPWAYPLSPHMFGGGSNISSFVVPDVGTELVVWFPYESIYFPMYMGYWQTGSTHQTEFDADYPETYGYRDKINNKCVINREQETIHFETSSEITVDTDEDGNVKIYIPGNKDEQIDKTSTKNINIDKKVTVGNNQEVTVMSNNSKKVLKNDNENIGINKTKNVVGNEIVNIGGNKSEIIVGSKSESVGGSSSSQVTGSLAQNITGSETKNAGVKISLNAPIINIISPVVNLGGAGGKKVVVHDDSTTVNGTHPHSHKCVASTTKTKAE
jgi:hypothetical protein